MIITKTGGDNLFRYLTNRILLALLTLFIILSLSYILMRLAPGDPAKSQMLGESQVQTEGLKADEGLSRASVLREKLYLDKPVYVGLFYWFYGLLAHGDLGESASVDKGRPVGELIMSRLPVTLRLNIIAVLITYMLAIPLGVYSAVKPDTGLDRVITFCLFFLYSLPVFWVALMFQSGLCVGGLLPLFPLKGVASGDITGLSTSQIIWDYSRHYILPVICLSYAGFAGLSRYARSGMLDVINQDYIRTARAKGVPEYIVIFKHALRNAMIILITLFAGILPGLIAGSIIVEYVFSIPGMGDLSMMALSSRDYPLLMALFGFAGILTLGGIMISDILYVVADPRISFDRSK